MSDTRKHVEEGFAHHVAGRLQEAEAVYLRGLEVAPNDPDLLYLLGTIEFQTGLLGRARIRLSRAASLRPEHVDTLNNLGLVLLDLGDADGAAARFEAAHRLAPGEPDPAFNLALARRRRGRTDEAVILLEKALARHADRLDGWNQLAGAELERGQPERALRASDRALSLETRNTAGQTPSGRAELWQVRGATLKALGRMPEAIQASVRAIELDRNLAEAWTNLCILMGLAGRLEEAAKAGAKAVELNPSSPIARNNFGMILHHLERAEEAAEQFAVAVRLAPEFAEAHGNLGASHFARDRLSDAEVSLRRALDLDPGNGHHRRNLAAVLDQRCRVEEAAEQLTASFRGGPEDRVWRVRRATLCPTVFDSAEAINAWRDEYARQLAELEPLSGVDPEWLVAADVRPPFNAQFHGLDELPFRRALARLVQPALAELLPPLPPRPPPIKPRIGFVCSDRHEVAFARSIGGLFRHFDPSRAETVIVTSPRGRPILHERGVPAELPTLELRDDLRHAARALREARFDILYWWEIGTCALNYLLPFLPLAPVQVTSWGIQVTSGIPTISSYLTSRWIEGDDADEHYGERLIRLDTNLGWQVRAPRPAETSPRARWGLDSADRVYLCPQHLGKFHPDFDPILLGILERDPRGRIVITEGPHPHLVERLRSRFRRTLGDAVERITFLPNQRGDAYASLLQTADALLDPQHFGGVNTTYDSLAVGRVPITLPTRYQRGRYTAGILRMIDLTETIADSADDYVRRAVTIANDPAAQNNLARRFEERSGLLFENPAPGPELQEALIRLARGE